MRLEMNGRTIDAGAAWIAALAFGHFTAMQVRGGATRGLDLHLDRLEAANRELFDAPLDRDRVRELVRHALGDTPDASVRVYVLETDGDVEPATVVTVKDPGGIVSPQRLRSADYLRPRAHLKHLATEQGLHTRAAREEGFDDALLTDGGGLVAEAATANIGVFDGDAVVWPDAPHLAGITMQLLQRVLPERRVPVEHRPLHLGDVGAMDGAFLSNARGIAEVSAIDDLVLPEAADRMASLADAYGSVPWDGI
jgi:branched-subunit amino acid aminotransferase/4-amino-4-deoxychorismate lyase